MNKLLAALLFFGLFAIAVAQEAPEAPTADETPSAGDAAAAESSEDAEPEFIDDSELDEQTYEEDEDVFVPTEEIPSDEPIPFPTNI
ncbi:MAG: hypothetical protein KJO19_10050 [Woeseia sp.]|nr:hypothetical protein [Woeseia sp.]MBT8097367.1 hypothetical protein [Woeseia sp.]